LPERHPAFTMREGDVIVIDERHFRITGPPVVRGTEVTVELEAFGPPNDPLADSEDHA
jgi:hypothetical protein